VAGMWGTAIPPGRDPGTLRAADRRVARTRSTVEAAMGVPFLVRWQGGDGRLAGHEPAPPVAGLPPADRGDLHRVVPAAVPRLDDVRAAGRELTAGVLIGAAAPLEHDVPLVARDVPPGLRDDSLTRDLDSWHQHKPVPPPRNRPRPGLTGVTLSIEPDTFRDSASDARPVPCAVPRLVHRRRPGSSRPLGRSAEFAD
jgi:hypothetical protein